MRAMGPGSISSLLKIALDVVYVAFFVVSGVLGIAALVVLALPSELNLVATTGQGDNVVQIKLTRMIVVGALAIVSIYLGGLVVVVGQLRKVFATLTIGDPFHPRNINRLWVIGLGLSGLQALTTLIRNASNRALPGAIPSGLWDVTAWLSVLVVFVLVMVFREGARLRREAELTI